MSDENKVVHAAKDVLVGVIVILGMTGFVMLVVRLMGWLEWMPS